MLAKLKKLDWITLLILMLFMVVSTLIIYSATIDNQQFGPQRLYYDNVRNYILGFVVLICAALIDYRWVAKFSILFYGLGIILLIAVFFFGS